MRSHHLCEPLIEHLRKQSRHLPVFSFFFLEQKSVAIANHIPIPQPEAAQPDVDALLMDIAAIMCKIFFLFLCLTNVIV